MNQTRNIISVRTTLLSAPNTLLKIEEADAELADLTDKSTSRAWEAGTNWNASVYGTQMCL